MRIIDKRRDYYDYLQEVYRDDSIVFDRTDSFMLEKSSIASFLLGERVGSCHFILMQVCNSFWLFIVQVTNVDKNGVVTDYDINLLVTWKDYDKPRQLIKIHYIEFKIGITYKFKTWNKKMRRSEWNVDDIFKDAKVLKNAVDTNEYNLERELSKFDFWNQDGSFVEKHIPILAASGIAALVDPLDIYTSLEEYFSLEKQSSERRESVGLTDKEKVENHGFDTKRSFRNMK